MKRGTLSLHLPDNEDDGAVGDEDGDDADYYNDDADDDDDGDEDDGDIDEDCPHTCPSLIPPLSAHADADQQERIDWLAPPKKFSLVEFKSHVHYPLLHLLT